MGTSKKRGKKAGAKRRRIDELSDQQARISVAIESLTSAVHELPAPASTAPLEEIRRLLDDVLVAQHRTNQLLELALRAGFDEDERLRTS